MPNKLSLNQYEDAEIKEMGVLKNNELMVFDGKFWRILGGSRFSPDIRNQLINYLFDFWGGSNTTLSVDLEDILEDEDTFFKTKFIEQALSINSAIKHNEQLLLDC